MPLKSSEEPQYGRKVSYRYHLLPSRNKNKSIYQVQVRCPDAVKSKKNKNHALLLSDLTGHAGWYQKTDVQRRRLDLVWSSWTLIKWTVQLPLRDINRTLLLNRSLGKQRAKQRFKKKHFCYAFDGSDGKESACKAGDLGSILGLRISPGEGHGQPTAAL